MKKSTDQLMKEENRKINPDGIDIELYWERATVGSSMFIPCLNLEVAKRQVKKQAKNNGFLITCKSVIEKEKLGLRVWIIGC